MTAMIKSLTWEGPCAQNPAGWDLDAGTLEEWVAAMLQCLDCPVLARCRQVRDEFWPDADPRRPAHNPRGVILAGVAYSESGRVLDSVSLRRLAALRRNRERKAAATAAAGVDRVAS
jgi:hypothetical protein